MARNGVIGKDNGMPWRLRDDLRRFRKLTTGHCVLMGRKTFESLGKPLPGRTNIVITRRRDWQAAGTEVCHSLPEALDFARQSGETELFVIGGGEIYTALLPVADRMYLTRVLANVAGDAFFPEFDEGDWEVFAEEARPAGEGNDFPFVFLDLERRRAKSAGE